MKTHLTKWLAATLVLSTAMSPSAALAAETTTSKAFVDLGNISTEKQAAIEEAVRQGLLAGDPNGQFRPTEELTRQELAALLVKALHLQPVVSSTSSFQDVRTTDWGLPYIEAVRQAGLMVGNEKGEFRPLDHISREELAATFVRAVQGVGALGGTSATLSDSAAVSTWARDAVDTATRLGLIDIANGQFNPQGKVQRQDIANLLLSIFQTQERTAVINGVDGDVVTIDGVPYLIEGKLKQLLSGVNAKALQGATLKYNSVNRNVDNLSELKLVQAGVTFDAGNFAGVLTIAANNVVIQGSKVNQIVVDKGVTSVQLDTQATHVTVNSDQPLQLNGKGKFEELQVTNPKAQIKLGQGIEVANVKLPDNIKLSQIIQNLTEVTQNVKTVQTGIDDRKSNPSPGGSTPDPQPMNHAPTVKNALGALTKKVSDGVQTISLLNTFEDADGDALTYTASSSDATVATASIANGTLTVTPLQVGTATITVTAKDPSNATVSTTFTITVQPEPAVNHAPTVKNVLSNLTKKVSDGVQIVSLANAFEDEDGDALTYTASSSDTTVATVSELNGTLTVTPLSVGTATITVIAKDPSNATVSTTFTITVQAEPPVNHAPTVKNVLSNLTKKVSDGVQIVSLANAFEDEDGDALTYTASSSDTTVATVSELNGTLTVTPLSVGTATITVIAKDPSNATVSTTFTITVQPEPAVNHAPTVKNVLSDLTKKVSDGVQTVSLANAFEDEDGDALTYTASSSDTTVATVSELNGTLTVTPLQVGTATITVIAKDPSNATVSTTFTITVQPEPAVNHAPTVKNVLSDLTKKVSDGVQTVSLANAFEDEDGDALTYTASSSDTTVATVSELNGTLTVTPLSVGTATITVIAKDPSNATVSTTFTITVQPEPAVNHAPTVKTVLSDLTKKVSDGVQTVSLANVFEDEDGDVLTYTASSSDTTVATVSELNGTLTVTPLSVGTATITVIAKDPSNATVSTTFTITVQAEPAVNHAPTVKNALTNLSQNVLDGAQTVSLTDVFEDQDGDALTYTAVSSDATIATVSVTNGVLTITPLKAGTATITVTAADTSNATASTTFTVTLSDSTLFISETYWDINDYFFQAFELYNPTDADIDLSDVSIDYYYANGSNSSLTLNGTLEKGKTYLIGEEQCDPGENYPNLHFDYTDFFWFFEDADDNSTIVLILKYKGEVIDIAHLLPYKDIRRAPNTVKGESTLNLAHWIVQDANSTSDLGKYEDIPL